MRELDAELLNLYSLETNGEQSTQAFDKWRINEADNVRGRKFYYLKQERISLSRPKLVFGANDDRVQNVSSEMLRVLSIVPSTARLWNAFQLKTMREK